MLKPNSGATAGSLSSCRIKAESLAKAINSRIWPSTWADQRAAGDLSNGVTVRGEEEEEFFEASPVEEEGFRADDSSAATVAGRAKLYELLQQHATDDATDVFYDVSENAELSNIVCENGEGNSNEFDFSCEKLRIDDCQTVCSPSQKSSKTGEDIVPEYAEGNSNKNRLSREILQNEAICNPSSHTSNKDDDIVCEKVNENSLLDEIEQTSVQSLISADGLHGATGSHCSNDFSKTVNELISDNRTLEDVDCCIEDNVSFKTETDLPIRDGPNRPEYSHITVSSKICATNNEIVSSSETDNIDQSLQCQSDLDLQHPLPIHITEAKQFSFDSNFLENSENPTDEDVHDPRKLRVFDEVRPPITRSTSLKTGKTPPGTPSRKKIVRFADVLGLDLEDVRHIISGDLPNIPSSAYDDLVLTDDDKPSTVAAATVELKERQQGAWGGGQAAIGPNVLCPRFPIPGQQADFWDKLQAQGVCLESVVISDFNVHCTCRVMNWGFSKKVLARYTTSGWISSNEIDASYVPGSTQRDTDSFTFNIFLSSSYKNVEFALRYEVNGKEYWDNNAGKNYSLSCHGYGDAEKNYSFSSQSYGDNSHSPIPTSPSWLHQFW